MKVTMSMFILVPLHVNTICKQWKVV